MVDREFNAPLYAYDQAVSWTVFCPLADAEPDGCRSPYLYRGFAPVLHHWHQAVLAAVQRRDTFVGRVLPTVGWTEPDGGCGVEAVVLDPSWGPYAPGEVLTLDVDAATCNGVELGRPLDQWVVAEPAEDGRLVAVKLGSTEIHLWVEPSFSLDALALGWGPLRRWEPVKDELGGPPYGPDPIGPAECSW